MSKLCDFVCQLGNLEITLFSMSVEDHDILMLILSHFDIGCLILYKGHTFNWDLRHLKKEKKKRRELKILVPVL